MTRAHRPGGKRDSVFSRILSPAVARDPEEYRRQVSEVIDVAPGVTGRYREVRRSSAGPRYTFRKLDREALIAAAPLFVPRPGARESGRSLGGCRIAGQIESRCDG